MDSQGCTLAHGTSKPWEATVQTASLHKAGSPECSLLTSADLHALIQRPSFDNLDVCQLASPPESLFSPKGSHELALPVADSNLFADLFPGSLLFPSPTADPSPAPSAAAVAAAAGNLNTAAAAATRLPSKIFDHCLPAAVPVDAVAAAAATAAAGQLAARSLLCRLDSAASHEDTEERLAAEPLPKRRRTSLFPQPAEPAGAGFALDEEMAAAAGGEPGSVGCEDEDQEEECEEGDGPSGAGHGYHHAQAYAEEGDCDARLESKRARNREAARRMRQRQRQHICKLEEDLGHQFSTIQGLLGKLHTLTSEMKCTSQENDLLKQLLTSAAAAAAAAATTDDVTGAQQPGAAAGQLPLCFPPSGDAEVDGLLSASLYQGLSAPAGSPQEQYLLPQQAAGPSTAVGCSPMKLFSSGSAAAAEPGVPAPAPSPAARPPRAASVSLPPSPFESPRKAAPSPSKPLTPQRLALRSPFAAPPQRPSRLSMALSASLGGELAGAAAAPAQPTCAAGKAALVDQLASGGAPLAHGVALALLRGLQEQQELELGGEAPGAVTEEEAAFIAATALVHSQGNVNGAVMQLLAWAGHAPEYPVMAC